MTTLYPKKLTDAFALTVFPVADGSGSARRQKRDRVDFAGKFQISSRPDEKELKMSEPFTVTKLGES
jgi:hypothetical protein